MRYSSRGPVAPGRDQRPGAAPRAASQCSARRSSAPEGRNEILRGPPFVLPPAASRHPFSLSSGRDALQTRAATRRASPQGPARGTVPRHGRGRGLAAWPEGRQTEGQQAGAQSSHSGANPRHESPANIVKSLSGSAECRVWLRMAERPGVFGRDSRLGLDPSGPALLGLASPRCCPGRPGPLQSRPPAPARTGISRRDIFEAK